MRIVEAFVIDTKALIDFLCIDKQYALLYLKVKAQVPRGVNILASATAKDLRELASFRVDEKGIHTSPKVKTQQVIIQNKRKWTQKSIKTFLQKKRKSNDKSSILYYFF